MVPAITGWLRRFVKAGWIQETALALPRLALMIPKLLRDKRVPFRVRAALFGLGLYLASPWDILPDLIPIIGQIDDAVVLLILVDGILNQIQDDVLLDHWTGQAATLHRMQSISRVISAGVPSKLRAFIFGKAASIGERAGSKNP